MRILISDSHARHIGRALSRAFLELGHECRNMFDDAGLYASSYRILTASPFRAYARAVLMARKLHVGVLLKKTVVEFKPDLIIVIQGDYFLKDDIAWIAKNFKIPIVNWLVHDPVRTEFYDPLRLGELAEYSHLFIADEAWLPGVYFFEKPVMYLPLAGDPTAFEPLKSTRKDTDILFVGDLFPPSPGKTSGLVHARVLEGLLAHGFRVHASVSGKAAMKKFVPALKELTGIRGRQTPESLNVLYNRSKIVLTLFPLDYKKDAAENFFNVALTKSFQLVEQKRNIEKMFGDGVVTFRSQEELVQLVRRYLDDDTARAVSAAALYDEVRQAHSYQGRAAALLFCISAQNK